MAETHEKGMGVVRMRSKPVRLSTSIFNEAKRVSDSRITSVNFPIVRA